jgi:RNA polymerase sigma-70 factor (ECF subfamily)
VDWDEVDARIDAQAHHDRLRAALSAMSASERELLLLVAWEGLSTAEAARVIGIAPSAARKRLQRARERSAHLLGDDPPDEPRQTLRTMTADRPRVASSTPATSTLFAVED